MSPSARRWLAEILGTYVLVLFGSFALLSAIRTESGILGLIGLPGTKTGATSTLRER